MFYKILGKTNIRVSVVGFGAIMLDQVNDTDAGNIVSKAIDGGVNYFDVAPTYGNSQYVLGSALESYRKDVTLTCKSTERSQTGITKELEESLRALKTDYFDVYQLHNTTDFDEIEKIFAPDGAMEALIKAKQKGYIRNIGFTCHHDEAALRMMDLYDFDTMMLPVNWLYWIKNNEGEEAVTKALKQNMGVLSIKTCAKRRWNPGEKSIYPHCWYKPIDDDDELAKLALLFALSKGVHSAMSPGAENMLMLMIDIINNSTSMDFDWELLNKKVDEIDGEVIFEYAR
ncbi:MAG: aldo/keto reductase [Oscillospiraceae bacterium]|nr:aldo/keto reductase [Oscillospiraceae bacterium]